MYDLDNICMLIMLIMLCDVKATSSISTQHSEASAVEGEEDLAHGLSDCHALHVARLQNALRCLRKCEIQDNDFWKPKYFWQPLQG